ERASRSATTKAESTDGFRPVPFTDAWCVLNDPKGITAHSRGLSAAIPPVARQKQSVVDPNGVAQQRKRVAVCKRSTVTQTMRAAFRTNILLSKTVRSLQDRKTTNRTSSVFRG